MQVIKKSGRVESFSLNKLGSSINSANYGTSEKIDIDSLLSELEEIVKDKRQITTRHLDIIVTGLLYTNGYVETLHKYMSYEKSIKNL